ncbi:MAG: 8-amino-7-oxononanoate synthase [Bacteroidota bacterium]
MKPSLTFILNELSDRRELHRFRRTAPVPKGLISFCSNDYLGLSRHPALIEASRAALEASGTGSGASRLVSGTQAVHQELEKELAAFTGRESALLFNSGFQMNTTLIAALADRSSLVYMDRLNHNSLYQGALLSRATLRRYAHLDMAHLERMLTEDVSHAGRKLIITESVFSMDGDVAPIDALIDLAARFDAILIVDEAHSLGLEGDGGRGLCFGKPGVDILLGTFGKSFGSFGAFAACDAEVRDYLVNTCSGFIYTTALPPSVVAATLEATRRMPGFEAERRLVRELSSMLRAGLTALGVDTRGSQSAIVPAVIGSDAAALAAAERLAAAGFLVQAIRPPTVEEGTARLRFTLNASHTHSQVSDLLTAFAAS